MNCLFSKVFIDVSNNEMCNFQFYIFEICFVILAKENVLRIRTFEVMVTLHDVRIRESPSSF